MLTTTLNQVAEQAIRVVILEAFSQNNFGLTGCLDDDNITFVDQSGKPYKRGSVAQVMQDISLLNIGDIFIHCRGVYSHLEIPDYLKVTDYGNGVIHIMPKAFLMAEPWSQTLKSS
jgi:hypothetical protein